jgi:hypothetical protein
MLNTEEKLMVGGDAERKRERKDARSGRTEKDTADVLPCFQLEYQKVGLTSKFNSA